MSIQTKTVTRTNQFFEHAITQIKENRFAYALVLPTILFLVLLLWVPFLRGIWISFHEWVFLEDPRWVGLDNYRHLFTWDLFYISVRATIIYSLATVIQLGMALGLALLVANLNRFQGLLSAIYLIPYTMPPVVTGTMWLYLLDPSIGPFFQYLIERGIISEAIYWTVSGDSALVVITLVASWTFWPFMFLFILASRMGIPDEHYETARVYGANRVQMFWRVTFPQIKSAILVAIIIRFVWNLAKISQPLQLTGGGPSFETSVLAILLYRQAWENAAFGVGYAVGIVLLVFTLVAIIPFIYKFEQMRGDF
ncbi:carbohydrate ABC transporter permease [Natronosalvus amylolyticus]|uniref:carbohydrate ABC transporter permease n=1 Tax=Natronosalvus amylolyticus TaxID=2961994 RepID=UPI0020CA1067|nr:sugar ABC transporter permease [Natronosalvus amylolyticus]